MAFDIIAGLGAVFREDIKGAFQATQNFIKDTLYKPMEHSYNVYQGKCYSDQELKLTKKMGKIYVEVFSSQAEILVMDKNITRNKKIISDHCFQIEEGNALFRENSIFRASIIVSGIQATVEEKCNYADRPFNRYCETIKDLLKHLSICPIEDNGKQGAVHLAGQLCLYANKIRDHYNSIKDENPLYIHAATIIVHLMRCVQFKAKIAYSSTSYAERFKVLEKGLGTLLPYLAHLRLRMSYYHAILQIEDTPTDFRACLIKEHTEKIQEKFPTGDSDAYLIFLKGIKQSLNECLEHVEIYHEKVLQQRENLVGTKEKTAEQEAFVADLNTNGGQLAEEFKHLKERIARLSLSTCKQIGETKTEAADILRLASKYTVTGNAITQKRERVELIEESPRRAKVPKILDGPVAPGGSVQPLALENKSVENLQNQG